MFKKLLVLLSLFYAALSFAAVDVNTASAADLDSVKGIGPGMSKRIINERAKGQFKDWGDFIARVKGLGEKNAANFSAGGMTVNGAGYAGAPAKPQGREGQEGENRGRSAGRWRHARRCRHHGRNPGHRHQTRRAGHARSARRTGQTCGACRQAVSSIPAWSGQPASASGSKKGHVHTRPFLLYF